MPPSIDGIYELGHVLYALDADTHGFARGDIARVERFWTFGDLHSSEAGFVFHLRDGRRAYVDFEHTHAYEQVEDFRIDVEFLAPDQAHPILDRPGQSPAAWSTDTARLDRMLRAST